jgi:hypothetical protein
MVTLGPSGTARLASEVVTICRDREQDPDGSLYAAMSQTFATGSSITVDDGHDGTRYLMDAEWLDTFSPHEADPSGTEDTDPPGLYRPDLLLPFLREPGVSENFATVVADRALTDYEKYWKDDDTRDYNRFQWYYGRSATAGNPSGALPQTDPDDPWGPVLPVALARAGDYPNSSNTVLMQHLDTIMTLSTGQDHVWTGGEIAYGRMPDLASPALAKILSQGTVGMLADGPSGTTVSGRAALSDSVVSQVGVWLGNHSDQHLVGAVRTSLTDVLLDDRYVTGVTNSLGTPFAPAAGVVTDPTFGALMPKTTWQALHQEAMREPETAARFITTLGQWIDENKDDAQHMGYSFPSAGEKAVPDPSVSMVDLFRGESVRAFLAGNLLADQKSIQDELDNALADNEKGREQSKAVLTTLFGFATNPASITSGLAGLAGGVIIDQVVDSTATSPSAIADRYQGEIDGLAALSKDNPVVSPTVWTDMTQTASQLADDHASGTGANSVQTPQPDYDDDDPARPVSHDGDPRAFVGHRSEYVGAASGDHGSPVITDDFLQYETDGGVAGVLPPGEMNHLQRESYMKWLQDPSVQQYLADREAALTTVREWSTQ